jgi:hypothetical protein
VALGRKAHDGARLVPSEQTPHKCAVTDIPANKVVPRIVRQRREVAAIASVSQRLQIEDGTAAGRDAVANEICANEAGAAG